jgi:hypothetical protein
MPSRRDAGLRFAGKTSPFGQRALKVGFQKLRDLEPSQHREKTEEDGRSRLQDQPVRTASALQPGMVPLSKS